MSGFYNPLSPSPDYGSGIFDLMQQFMMMRLIKQLYPDEKGKKGKGKGMPDIGNILMGETPLAPAREMPMGQLPMGQMGQAPQQQPGGNIQQILQILQMLGMGQPGGVF